MFLSCDKRTGDNINSIQKYQHLTTLRVTFDLIRKAVPHSGSLKTENVLAKPGYSNFGDLQHVLINFLIIAAVVIGQNNSNLSGFL